MNIYAFTERAKLGEAQGVEVERKKYGPSARGSYCKGRNGPSGTYLASAITPVPTSSSSFPNTLPLFHPNLGGKTNLSLLVERLYEINGIALVAPALAAQDTQGRTKRCLAGKF